MIASWNAILQVIRIYGRRNIKTSYCYPLTDITYNYQAPTTDNHNKGLIVTFLLQPCSPLTLFRIIQHRCT